MLPKFEHYQERVGGVLCCPNCGFDYLHHERVEIFERNEDATTGLHVTVEKRTAAIDTKLKGNPSSRRHGMKIFFTCENCEAIPVLIIEQHKGYTYMDFNSVSQEAAGITSPWLDELDIEK